MAEQVYSYLEIARELVDTGTGLSADSVRQAGHNLLKDRAAQRSELNLGSWAVWAFVRRIERSFIDETRRRMSDKIDALVNTFATEFLENRTKKHGPAPREVRIYAYRAAWTCAVSQVLHDYRHYDGNLNPPPGHPARKSYDTWMRRCRTNTD